jgi:hypothetical protein
LIGCLSLGPRKNDLTNYLGPWAFREAFYFFSGPRGYLSPTGTWLGLPVVKQSPWLYIYIYIYIYIRSSGLPITKGSPGQIVQSGRAGPGPDVYKRKSVVLGISFSCPSRFISDSGCPIVRAAVDPPTSTCGGGSSSIQSRGGGSQAGDDSALMRWRWFPGRWPQLHYLDARWRRFLNPE